MSATEIIDQQALNFFVKNVGAEVASQLEACTRCGLCADACHFYISTGNPEYTPIWKVELLRRAYEQNYTILGKLKTAIGLDKRIDTEDIAHWAVLDFQACTVCKRCSFVCPMGIDIAGLIGKVRAGLTAAHATPPKLMAMTKNQLEKGSPDGSDEAKWAAWFKWGEEQLGKSLPMDVKGADSLVVFTMLELNSFRNNLVHIARIMNAAGEKWTLSLRARDAFNMGTVIGDGAVQKKLAERIVKVAHELGVKRIIVTECGHGYVTLRQAAHNLFGETLPFDVVHITELMGDFVRQGRLKLRKGYFDNEHRITYHDACKIQRIGGNFDSPREILNLIAPSSFVEMNLNREQSFCCGGGGGVRAIPEAYDLRMEAFSLKAAQMREVDATDVVMSCSNCRLQFKEGFEHFRIQGEVKGLVEMVAEAMIE
ncbi:MAG TPA: (Fe-S)-binding protein [Chloroflexi bacterium]|nr:(Fe-S)-binding protein [Chloroflexota bacterium]